jgi:hypothetical protein
MWRAPSVSLPLSYGIAFSAVMFFGPNALVAMNIPIVIRSATRRNNITGK